MQRAIVESRHSSVRGMYPNIIPNPYLSVIDDLLPCLATSAEQGWKSRGSGKKVGRAAANRTMALQADSLVPMSCYSAVAILSNMTREYEPLFSNASSDRCVCNAPLLSHAILQREECIRILSLIYIQAFLTIFYHVWRHLLNKVGKAGGVGKKSWTCHRQPHDGPTG